VWLGMRDGEQKRKRWEKKRKEKERERKENESNSPKSSQTKIILPDLLKFHRTPTIVPSSSKQESLEGKLQLGHVAREFEFAAFSQGRDDGRVKDEGSEDVSDEEEGPGTDRREKGKEEEGGQGTRLRTLDKRQGEGRTEKSEMIPNSPLLLQRSHVVRRQNLHSHKRHLVHQILHVRTAPSHTRRWIREFAEVDAMETTDDGAEFSSDGGKESFGVAGVEGFDSLVMMKIEKSQKRGLKRERDSKRGRSRRRRGGRR